jgi:hypothetical protein
MRLAWVHGRPRARADPPRRRGIRLGWSWRWAAGVAGLALASAAFLLWGPVGLGSGPLTVFAPSGGQLLGVRIQGIPEQNRAWGLMVGLQAGSSGAVIDSVAVAGGGGYSRPDVLSAWTVSARPGSCAGDWPWSGPESILSFCAAGSLQHLIGQRLPGNNPGVDMVLKIGPPAGASGCWAATSMTVHYHVGIRHYTVTSHGSFAACKTRSEESAAADALGLP